MSLGVKGNWWGGSGGGVVNANVTTGQYSYTQGEQAVVSASLTLGANCSGAALTLDLYKDGELLTRLLDQSVDFVKDVPQNFTVTTDALALGAYYMILRMSGGAPALPSIELGRCQFRVLSVLDISFGSDTATDRNIYYPGDRMVVSFVNSTSRAMIVFINSYIAARGSDAHLADLFSGYVPLQEGDNHFEAEIPSLALPPGQYYIGGSAASSEGVTPFVITRRCQFTVLPTISRLDAGTDKLFAGVTP